MTGYGSKGKIISWPNNAKLALQIVLNYEEGGENCILNGDKYSETFLSEIIGAQPVKGRHISMESIYEFGSRADFKNAPSLAGQIYMGSDRIVFNARRSTITLSALKSTLDP